MSSIGEKISCNPQLQEFVERALGLAFDMMCDEESETIDNFCDDMQVSKEEVWWMFKELAYDRYEGYGDD